MRRALSESLVKEGHPDFELLQSLAAELDRCAGGDGVLEREIPKLLRECIDDVIQTPRTGRRCYEELEKTEKTYIGTRVEIMLRSLLGLPRGKLDIVILGHDVDIKHTMGKNWMIPNEALGQPCLLVGADEIRARCCFGLFIAKTDYLTKGVNRDRKRTLSSFGLTNILWKLKDCPYPKNFWQCLPQDVVEYIFKGKSGNERVTALFRQVRDIPISRRVVESVAKQKDFMRRIRGDGARGTRDRLAKEGIYLLSGAYDRELIRMLGLRCDRSEFISHAPRDENERQLIQSHLRAV